VAAWARRVRDFSSAVWTQELHRLRVRAEDKDAISAFHWRGAPDEAAAHAAVEEVASAAEEAGLVVHWGRKVLEVRPPVALDKGRGVRALLRGTDIVNAVYVGDDTTDLDAFRGLRDLVDEGALSYSLCIGVRSDETPPAILDEADELVDGPAGVRGVLGALQV
jgi:trehalose 6-phosphate phosphatase